jgi:hypothetical protein
MKANNPLQRGYKVIIMVVMVSDYPFPYEQSGRGFLLYHLVHEEFFKGDNLFGIEGGCHEDLGP